MWRVRRYPGGEEYRLRGEVELIASTKQKPWVRPPINVDFQVQDATSVDVSLHSPEIPIRIQSLWDCSVALRLLLPAEKCAVVQPVRALLITYFMYLWRVL